MQNLCQIWKCLLCRLLRNLYNLKQSKRLWNQNVITFYKGISFVQFNWNPSILICYLRDKISIISIYIDDFFLISNTISILNVLKQLVSRKYDTKDLSEVKTIIGWQINWDTAPGAINIDQSAFVRDLVIEKKLTNHNTNIILMKARSSIKMTDPEDYKEANLYIYQRLVGTLMYLLYSINSDIAFVVGQLSRYNTDLRKRHLWAIKKVVWYLERIIEMHLTFGQESTERLSRAPLLYGLISYANSKFAKDPEDWKLVIGYCFFLNGAMVSWSSKKQRTVFTSTIKVKYIALGYAARGAV